MGKDKPSAPTLFVGGPVQSALARTPCCATFRRKFHMGDGQARSGLRHGQGLRRLDHRGPCPILPQLQPEVPPQVLHFMQVPLRTSV